MPLMNIPIARKLTFGFAAVILVSAVVSVIQWQGVGVINAVTSDANDDLQTLIKVEQVANALEGERSAARAFIASAEPKFVKDVEDERSDLHAKLDEMKALFRPEETDEQQRLQTIADSVSSWEKNIVDVELAAVRNPATRQNAVDLMSKGPSLRYLGPALIAVKEMRERERAQIDTAMSKQGGATTFLGSALLLGAILSVTLAGVIGWLLSRSIARPLVQMTRSMERLAAGDHAVRIAVDDRRDEIGNMAKALLTLKDNALEKLRLEADAAEQKSLAEIEQHERQRERERKQAEQEYSVQTLAQGLERLSHGDFSYQLQESFPAEYEKLRQDFNATVLQLQRTMQIIIGNAEGLRSGAGEISNAADSLSYRTEQQAASLEETAAALDQITATVKKTAHGTSVAREVVGKAKQEAEESEIVVGRAVSVMGEIEQSSKQISQIIGVIDEIAFQTNLLALNAGVEAARAGDAGRGFAVVATEVRALAQRTADAAKEIKVLISNSSRQVGSGVDFVGEAGAALQRIAAHVTGITTVVEEIAASAQEQATGLNEVNSAVNQMDQMTQQNAAMVEQSTAASRTLAAEVESLSDLMRGFRLGEPAKGPRITSDPPPRARNSQNPAKRAESTEPVRHDRRKAPRPPKLKAIAGSAPPAS